MAAWNVVAIVQTEAAFRDQQDDEYNFLMSLWTRYFARARDEYHSGALAWSLIKTEIMEGAWNEVLDILEAAVTRLDTHFHGHMTNAGSAIANALNGEFERLVVGYRFIGHELTPIDSALEVEAVAAASEDARVVDSARHHLGKALDHLSDRENPDYLNSIKESISGVEAVARRITGKQTLGDALDALKDAGIHFHGALLKAWKAMYGFTSDADGVRHGGETVAEADQALAKYILVTCSAFVSLLVEEGRKAGKL